MIYLNDVGGNGLGKPKGFSKLKKFAQFAVAPQTLLLNKKQNQKLFKVVKTASAPQTLLRKKSRPQRHSEPQRERRVQVQVQEQPAVIYAEPTNETTDDLGLGKPKKGIKKLVRKVNLKNTLKVVKFAGPLVAGIVPGGGTAMKVVDSKVGKTALKVAKSKVVKKGVSLSKKKGAIPVKRKGIGKKSKKLVKGSKGEDVRQLQESLGIEADGDFGPKTEAALQQATGSKSITTNSTSYSSPVQSEAYNNEPEVAETIDGFGTPPLIDARPKEKRPFGKLTSVVELAERLIPEKREIDEVVVPKDNTMLYVGSAVALAGIAFLATRKE
jgi:hypothetical protein